MKKLFAILPIIWLVLGTVAIATELRRPVTLEPVSISLPICTTVVVGSGVFVGDMSQKQPVLCSQ
jgi:hypothetical protein